MAPTSALVVVELCSRSRTRSLPETQKSSAPNYQGWCARCLRHSTACGGVAATDGKCAPNSACMAASTLVVGRSLPALHCRKRAGHSANVRRSAMRGGSHCRRRPGLVCAPCVAHHTLARIRLTAKRLRSQRRGRRLPFFRTLRRSSSSRCCGRSAAPCCTKSAPSLERLAARGPGPAAVRGQRRTTRRCGRW